MLKGPTRANHPRQVLVLLKSALLVVSCGAACSLVLSLILLRFQNFRDQNDFLSELWIPYLALHHGHVLFFVQHAPSYIGAVVERAPFALAALHFRAHWRVTYLATAVPCYLTPPVFGAWFAHRGGETAQQRQRIALVFGGFMVLDPAIWFVGVQGHPEELIGAMLALAAVLVAFDGRRVIAIVLILLAVLNKPGLAEVAPVVLAAMRGRLAYAALIASFTASLVYTLYGLTPLSRAVPIGQLTMGATSIGAVPFQFLWWLGASSWPVTHEHVLVVPVCVGLVTVWRVLSDRRPQTSQVVTVRGLLWLTAFVLLVRTAVEPGDTTYYNVPLIYCLLCLDLQRSLLPRMATAASVAVLLTIPENRIIPLGPTGQAVLYAAVVGPVLLGLAWRNYASPSARAALIVVSRHLTRARA